MDIEVVEERHHDVLVLLPIGRLDSGNASAFVNRSSWSTSTAVSGI